MTNQQPQYLTHLGPQRRLFIPLKQFHIIGYKITLKQVIGYLGILNDALKITQNIKFLLTNHTIQYFLQLNLHLPIHNRLGQHLRLYILKSQALLVKGKTLNHLNIFITDNRFNRIISLMMNYLLNRRHILRT